MTMQLTAHPDYEKHYRVWQDGREIGYLRYADEAQYPVWRACDEAGTRVTEATSKKICLQRFEERFSR